MRSDEVNDRLNQNENNPAGHALSLPKIVNERVAAQILDVSVQSLRNNRCGHKGVPYFKIGKSVRYSVSDLTKYLSDRRIDPNQSS